MKRSKILIWVTGLAMIGLLASCHGKGNRGEIIEWPADEHVLVVNNGSIFTPDYVAIYPAVNAEGVANNINGMEATFHLPSVQAYAKDSCAELTMPKVAYSIGEELKFKYVLGGLCLPMVGDSVRVTKVVLISANADEPLWGTCATTISDKGEDPMSTITNDEAGKNTITLDCGEGVMLNDTVATDFYLVVPTGALESGFALEVYDGDKMVYEKRTTTAPGSGFVPRGTIRKMEGRIEIAATTDIL